MSLVRRDDLTPLCDSIYAIQGPNKSRFPFSNGFLILDKMTVLIDAGIGEEKIREIDENRRIDILIISHSHPDHVLAWHALKDRRLLLPKETPDSVMDLKQTGLRFTGKADKGAYWTKMVAGGLNLQPLRKPDGRFGHKTVLKIGETRLEAIHCPGHLEDHYAFFHRESGTLITTDIDFTEFGPWYGNPESDIELFRKSIHSLMELPYERVFSSHKHTVEKEPQAAFAAYLEKFEVQRQRVLDLCRPSRSLQQMVAFSPFYRNRMPDKILQRIFEETMIQKNLELLVRDGLVEEKYGQFRLTGS